MNNLRRHVPATTTNGLGNVAQTIPNLQLLQEQHAKTNLPPWHTLPGAPLMFFMKKPS